MYMNTETKIAGAAAAGGAIGAAQTALLREFLDNDLAKTFLKNTSSSPPLLMKQLSGFGSPSALVGLVGGAVGLAIGLASLIKGRITRSLTVSAVLVGYGTTALLTGVLSGFFPTTAWAAATSADPNNPIGAANIHRFVPSAPSNVSISGVRTLEA